MRPRFRKTRGGESPDAGAPADTDGPAETDPAETDPAEGPAPADAFERLLERQLDDRVDVAILDSTVVPATDPLLADDHTRAVADDRVDPPGPDGVPGPREPGSRGPDFWDQYDLAVADAALARVPPASVVAVVGPLESAMAVARRCRDESFGGSRDVYVLTQRREVAEAEDDWRVVGQPSDLVAVLEDGRSDFPVLVLDVPSDLPPFVQPLVERLRANGVGLVHYVLDGEPDDEDLATWYGQLGHPSVLDLVTPMAPERVLELLDRGEPVVSVAGMPLTPELLVAFRIAA